MYRALVISLALHLAVVAWALVSVPQLPVSETPPIDVTLITLTEFARLTQDKPDKDETMGNALLPAETPKKGAPPAPEPPLDAGGPTVTALQTLEPVPEEPVEEHEALQQSRDHTLGVEQTLADHEELKQEQTFDPGSIATVSTDPDKKVGALPVFAPDSQQRVGGREGSDTLLTARDAAALESAITAQLKRCLSPPQGDRRNESSIVTLRWHLNLDGSLDGEPMVARPKLGHAFEIAADDAIRAVKQCQPFKLEQGQYHIWRTIVWDFFDTRDEH